MLEACLSLLPDHPHKHVPHRLHVLRALHHLHLLQFDEAGGEEVLQQGGVSAEQLVRYQDLMTLQCAANISTFLLIHHGCLGHAGDTEGSILLLTIHPHNWTVTVTDK